MEAGSTTPRETAQMEGGFARKASGLVRDFSQVDAWIYNVLALNLVVLIAFFYVGGIVTFPHASLWGAVVICGVLCTFEAIVYAFFMATTTPESWVRRNLYPH